MKKITICLQAIVLLFCSACNKDDDTYLCTAFCCKVNGIEWEATTYTNNGPFGVGTGPTDLLYYSDTKYINLVGVRKLEDQSINQSINIRARPVIIGRNNIYVNNINLTKEVFKDWLNESGCIFHNLDTLNENIIEIIELDSINRKIEGTFQFTAINDCNDTVRITDGYFNMEYRF